MSSSRCSWPTQQRWYVQMERGSLLLNTPRGGRRFWDCISRWGMIRLLCYFSRCSLLRIGFILGVSVPFFLFFLGWCWFKLWFWLWLWFSGPEPRLKKKKRTEKQTEFNDYNGALFTIRARSLNGMIYWLSQMFGSVSIGLILDSKQLTRRIRAFTGWMILFVMVFVVHIWGYFYQRYVTPHTI